MQYVGHSKIYYRGSTGYKLCASDDGSFYSVYFDPKSLPVVRILAGERNAVSYSNFRESLDVDCVHLDFDARTFFTILLLDLKDNFDLDVEVIL